MSHGFLRKLHQTISKEGEKEKEFFFSYLTEKRSHMVHSDRSQERSMQLSRKQM
jgi:hypothetical protein